MKALALLRSVTGQKSVADVLAVFTNVVADLEAIAGREAQRASDLRDQADALNTAAGDASFESGRAAAIATKLRGLVA